MKKLGKLNINSEKIMKNEELLTLRGGYDTAGCNAKCSSNSDCTVPGCPHCEYPAGNPDTKFCFAC